MSNGSLSSNVSRISSSFSSFLLTTFVKEARLRTSSAAVVSNKSSLKRSFVISSRVTFVRDSLASSSKAASNGSSSSSSSSFSGASFNSDSSRAILLVRATFS